MPDFAAVPAQITIHADGSASGPGILNFRGMWNNLRAYAVGDAVIYNGVAYNCIAPITPPDQGLGPGIQGIAPLGRLSNGIQVAGHFTGNEPGLSGANNTAHAQCWQMDIGVSGTVTVTWTVVAQYNYDSNGASLGGANSPAASPLTNGTFHSTNGGICYICPGAGPNGGGFNIATPCDYVLTATNGTATIIGAPVNPTPDTDGTHWSNAGI